MTYLWAGYIVTWIAVAGYAWRLGRRVAEAERELLEVEERTRAAPPSDGHPPPTGA